MGKWTRGPTRYRLNLDALTRHLAEHDLDDLAACWRTGIPPSTIWRLRTGRTKLCTPDTMERLLDGLGISFEELVAERVGRLMPGAPDTPLAFERRRRRVRRLSRGA